MTQNAVEPTMHGQFIPDGIKDGAVAAALRGERIYGDDFDAAAVGEWFEAERDGYSSLAHEDALQPVYVYGAMDRNYGWRHMTSEGSLKAMGLGSAFGCEFETLAPRLQHVTIVEPQEFYWRDEIAGVPASYVSPNASGRIPAQNQSFDLVTAFGVLHHIPTVTATVAELVRVLRPGGRLMIREPITSMGDWRHPRPGLTARERGIPPALMEKAIAEGGGQILSVSYLGFGPLLKLASVCGIRSPWKHKSFVAVDRLCCQIFKGPGAYHRTTTASRFAPAIGYWVVTK